MRQQRKGMFVMVVCAVRSNEINVSVFKFVSVFMIYHVMFLLLVF